jgi:hypothetical protein
LALAYALYLSPNYNALNFGWVQRGSNEVWRTLEADNSGGVSKGLLKEYRNCPDECRKLLDKYWKL